MPDMDAEVADGSKPDSSGTFTRIMHYAIGGLLVVGALAYWYLKPAGVNPMADPRAAEAIALVQTHRGEHAPTLLHAITNRVTELHDRGKGARRGEWRVEHLQDDLYVVSVWIREEGTKQWFERDYSWQVSLSRRSIAAMTPAAADLLPRELRRPNPLVPGVGEF